jgi:hypothetical protein
MPTPSLLIVPARFKSGKLYSQLPTSGAGDFTVTRATTATRVNASGLIESVASGIPRLDYFASGGTVGCPALLVEPAGTNLAFHSEVWTSGNNWTFTDGVTSVSASITAPDNTQAVNALSPTSANSSHFFYSNNPTAITYTSGTIYTQSIFFKQGTGAAGRYVQLTYPSARFTQLGFANFDLQGGVVTASGGTADTNRNARIENYGNGWYRCSLTATCNAAGNGVGALPALSTTSGATRLPTFSGTVTDVIYGWGAQLETGSVPTSYIPTTTASVTRNADVVSVSGAVSGSIGQLSGTIYAEVDFRQVAAGTIFVLDDGDPSDFINILKQSNLTISVRLKRASGTLVTIITSSAVALGVHKIALAYKNGDYALYIDGVSAGTSTNSTDYPATALVRCVLSNTDYGPLNDRIRAAALYPTRLSNAELAALTSL